ncbi:Na(+)-translocating NADH-quinone reductase subunit C [Aliikangiella maris]|uniref:Na(+)-translocating NADH-quinone reductase subunit C n=2 Tax=Aliikangiella maris TaxID=3162458 RepID=A0ABV3MSB2_9GAMM
MSANNDSFIKTIIVAVSLCLVCSVLVSTTAVSLKDQQTANASLDKKKNILVAANLFKPDTDIEQAFANIERKFVDIETGRFVSVDNPATFNQRQNAKDPATSIKIEDDIAKIKRRSKVASVYLVRDGAKVETIILPIRGSGLFSTLYGFIALKSDKQTIVGLKFYEHGETPGLGGEVDNPNWLALWPGKQLLDNNGKPVLKLVKGGGNGNSEVDALSGATMTTNGIRNMLKYWMGDDAFGPFLAKLDVNTGDA